MASPSHYIKLTNEEVETKLKRFRETLQVDPRKVSWIEKRGDQEQWELRLDALQSLRQLLSADMTHHKSFLSWMSAYVKVPLKLCMKNQRTAIAAAASSVVLAVVESSSSQKPVAASTFCSWFVEDLLRASSGSVKVVSRGAMEALNAVATRCLFSSEGLRTLLRGCVAAFAQTRLHALEVLQAFLTAAKGTPNHLLGIHAYALPLTRALHLGFDDAHAGVRERCRCCFWCLYVIEPVAAEEVFRALTPTVQRRLMSSRDEAVKNGGTDCKGLAPVPPALHDVATKATGMVNSAAVSPMRRTLPLLRQPSHNGGGNPSATMQDDFWSAVAYRKQLSTSPSAQYSVRKRAAIGALSPYALGTENSGRIRGTQSKTRLAPPSDLSSLKVCLQSPEWATRAAALQATPALLQKTEEGFAEPVLLHAIAAGCRDHHFRVRVAALQSLFAMVQQIKVYDIVTTAPEVMIHLVENTLHAHPSIRGISCVLLEQLLRESPLKECLAVLQRAFDEAQLETMRQRIAEVLEYRLLLVIKGAADSAALRDAPTLTYPLVGQIVRTLSTQLQRGHEGGPARGRAGATGIDSPLQHSLSVAVAAVFLAAPLFFQRLLPSLNSSDRETVVDALRNVLPEMATDNSTLAESPEMTSEMMKIVKDHAAALPCPFAALLEGALSRKDLLPPPPVVDDSQCETSSPQVSAKSPVVAGAGSSCARATRTEKAPEFCSRRGRRHSTLHSSAQSHHTAVVRSDEMEHDSTAASAPEGRWQNDWYLVRDGMFDGSPFAPAFFTVAYFPASASYGSWASSLRGRRHSPDIAPPLLQISDSWLRYGSTQVMRESEINAGFLDHLHTTLFTCDVVGLLYTLTCTLQSSAAATWSEESLQHLLALFDVDSGITGFHDHRVRRRLYSALHAFLEIPVARVCVARRLSRLLFFCRAGMDDVFFEVQQEAALCFHLALGRCALPADLCLNALAACLRQWQEGESRDDALVGWLELLKETGRFFERLRNPAAPRAWATLTPSVLKRVASIVVYCGDHCVDEVRHTAVLVLVAMLAALETEVRPLLLATSERLRHLIFLYYERWRCRHESNAS